MAIAQNLRFLRDEAGLSQDAMAKELEITRARYAAYEEDRNEPSITMLIKISDYYKISIDALVRGDLTKADLNGMMKIGKNRLLFPIILDKEGKDNVELIPQKASAGYLNGYADPEYIGKLPVMRLPFVPVGKHRAFPIKGDSMPPVRDGSFIVGKYVETINEVKDGHTYVLLTRSEGIVYKRLYKKANFLELHSDNKTYQPYKVKHEDVLEIWEFVCCINTSDYKDEELNMNSIMEMLKSLKVEVERIRR